MQIQNRDIGALWRRESNRKQHLFELIAPPASANLLRGFPDANYEKSAIPDCAVVPQLAERSCPSAPHDQRLSSVVPLPHPDHLPTHPANQQATPPLPPS